MNAVEAVQLAQIVSAAEHIGRRAAGLAMGLDAAIDRLVELDDSEGLRFVQSVLDEHCVFDGIAE